MKPKKKHDSAVQKSWMLSALERLMSNPENLLLVETDGEEISRTRFYSSVCALMKFFDEQKFQKNTRIILDIDTRMHWQTFAVWCASQAVSAIACFWSPDMRFRHERNELQEADADKPALVVTGTRERANTWLENDKTQDKIGRTILCITPQNPDDTHQNSQTENILDIDQIIEKYQSDEDVTFARTDDTAARIYTQGSHDNARPVYLSYQHLLDQAEDLQKRLSFDDKSRIFIDLTSPNTASLTLFASCLLCGSILICRSIDNPIQPQLEKYHITHAFLLPQNMIRMKNAIQTPEHVSAPGLKWRKLCLNAGHYSTHPSTSPHKWTRHIIDTICIHPLKNKLFSELQMIISYGNHIESKSAEFFSSLGIAIYNAYTTCEFGFVHLHQFMGNGGFLKSIDAKIHNGVLAVKSKRSSSFISMDDLVFEDESCGLCTRRNFTITLENGTSIDVSPMREILSRNPLIDEIFIFGQNRPYLTALIYLDELPLNSWATSQNLPAGSFEELAQNPKVYCYIRSLVDNCNLRRAPNENIKKIAIIPRRIEDDPRILTPCGLTRRTAVEHRYTPLLK